MSSVKERAVEGTRREEGEDGKREEGERRETEESLESVPSDFDISSSDVEQMLASQGKHTHTNSVVMHCRQSTRTCTQRGVVPIM